MFYEYHNSCREVKLIESIRIDLLDKDIVSFGFNRKYADSLENIRKVNFFYCYENDINFDVSLIFKETTYLWHG